MQAFQGTTSTPTIVPDSPTHNVPPVQNAEPMQIAESLPARPTSIYPPHYLPTFPGSTTQSVEVDVIRSLQKQVVALEAVTERLTTLTVTCVSDKTANAAADGMLNVRSSAFKTVAELCVEYGYLQSDDDETIFCALCADTPQVASTVRGAAATCRNGEINLKQSIPGESGDQKRVLTLTELKKAVIRHLKSERHKFAEKLRAENEAAAKEKHDVSIAVARQAYLTVCESKSGLSYERLILNAFLLGVRVGVKQHGDDFFRQFVVSMHTVIVKGIAQFLRTPQPTTGKCPPFCIVADKLTALRRTGQLVGLLVLVDGTIKAVFAGCLPVVDGHRGVDIASNLLEALEPYGITPAMWQEQFTGQAYDGQYFNLHAHTAVCEKTNVSHNWAVAMHDGAHVLELTMGDCRQHRSLSMLPVDPLLLAFVGEKFQQWYKHTAKRVGDIQILYNYGKQYEELAEVAGKLNLKLYAPERYCDTRFAQAERKVYKNYILNWFIVHEHMETSLGKLFLQLDKRAHEGKDYMTKQLEEEFASAGKRQKEHHDFLLIGLVMCLVDVLGIVKDLSLKYQGVNQLPWELHQSTLDTHSVLRMCATQLRAGTVPMEHFPFLTTTRDLYSWAEFQTGKFCGVTLSIAPFADVAQALRGMRELVAALCERITDRMQQRIILKCPSQIKQMALCLDVRVLCGAVRRTMDGDESDALRALHTWAREVGKLDIGEFEDLQREHHTVKEKLCGVFEIAEFGNPHYGKWAKGSGVDIMQYMFTTKSFYADPSKPVRNWLYLFNHCVLKARCEAVVEGMGCVLDKHADPQRHLTMDKYTAEAMIHWNGPAAHECENFLTLALNEHFKSTRMPREQRFHHTDSRQRSVYPHGTVLHRYLTAKRHKSKFPWWEPANNSP
jgi:hypothetical protein